jgi:outer membrane protein assembly factor BamB
MKKKLLTSLFLLFISCSIVFAQNWSTFGGDNQRNGLSKMTGPQNVTNPYWTQSSSFTALGNAVYSFGDKFVTSRMSFSPYSGRIECRDLQTGNLEWTSPFLNNSSSMYTIGFTEDAVYGHDYDSDTIYAFDKDNGSILWRSEFKSSTFGANPGALFTCNGDLIVNGFVQNGIFTMRLDKNTGDTVWTNRDIIVIAPAKGLAMGNKNIYRLTGGITTPIRLTAIDIETGQSVYQSIPLAGDPDQEHPITVGPDGTIYFWRDGGLLYAFSDNGSSLIQLWSYTPVSAGLLTSDISVGADNSVFVFDDNKVKKIDQNGTVLQTSITFNLSQPSITIGNDSTVYLNSGTGNIYALSPNLQSILWQLNAPLGVYCNPALLKDGIMIVTEAGNTIRAYKPTINRKPVADFRVSTKKVTAGGSVDFFDQSSYSPSSWEWIFSGATTTNSNIQNPSGIIYNVPGIYDVQLITQNTFGSDTTINYCQIEVLPVSLSLIEYDEKKIKTYPNPTNGPITIRSENTMNNVGITVYNMMGQVVYNKINLLGNSFELTIDGLPGVYLVEIVDEQKKTQLKVIKN